jgi:radical SAM superfamily enzyme YgiQ (UPF0313 family)
MSQGKRPTILLVELPVFPKGVLSLGLPLLAAYFDEKLNVKTLDVNQFDWKDFDLFPHLIGIDYVGFKVSSQSMEHAISLTQKIKNSNPDVKVLWGGELPSLLPEMCLEHADCIVTKRVEGCLDELLADLLTGDLKQTYEGGSDFSGKHRTPLMLPFLSQGDYFSFMGLPLETSTGCDRFCRFCMVHTMQPGVKYRLEDALKQDLESLGQTFVNVLDYNIGITKEHLLSVCKQFEESQVLGWMCEMCLETLEDEEILEALSKSRCKMIYCGLESINEEGLKSVNKHKTNHPDNYRRIIKKVQSYGLNIASGFIVGLEGTTEKTFRQMLDFYNEVGIEYVKITFLTYNPGTYFYKVMQRSGDYTTEDISRFDGNHLTYLANGLSEAEMYSGTKWFIREFYSIPNIVRRSWKAHSTFQRRLETVLFNLCYGQSYKEWLKYDVLEANSTGIRRLMEKGFVRPWYIRASEWLLVKSRKAQLNTE